MLTWAADGGRLKWEGQVAISHYAWGSVLLLLE